MSQVRPKHCRLPSGGVEGLRRSGTARRRSRMRSRRRAEDTQTREQLGGGEVAARARLAQPRLCVAQVGRRSHGIGDQLIKHGSPNWRHQVARSFTGAAGSIAAVVVAHAEGIETGDVCLSSFACVSTSRNRRAAAGSPWHFQAPRLAWPATGISDSGETFSSTCICLCAVAADEVAQALLIGGRLEAGLRQTQAKLGGRQLSHLRQRRQRRPGSAARWQFADDAVGQQRDDEGAEQLAAPRRHGDRGLEVGYGVQPGSAEQYPPEPFGTAACWRRNRREEVGLR